MLTIGTPASRSASVLRRVEVGAPHSAISPSRCSAASACAAAQHAGHGVVPPVELHQVQPLHRQPLQRAFDDAADVRRVHLRQLGQVGHALGVHLQRRQALRAAARVEVAVQRFDAGVDVGAVHRVQAGVDEGGDVGDGTFAVDRTVVAGQLPAAADRCRGMR